MALLFQNCAWSLRSFHTTTCCFQLKRMFPVKVKSIKDTAQRLGFEKATDMYPEYPLDEPPKLWMVTQVQSLLHRPYWEKEAMKEMGLYRQVFEDIVRAPHQKACFNELCVQEGDIAVHVNAAGMNEILWTVKHLIKIQPVRFPQGLPEKSDVGFTQLQANGEFVIYKKIKTAPEKEDDVIPRPAEEDWKVVDGYRMCKNCKVRRCLKYGMCQKVWLQRGTNNIEKLGPRMFNYVENPLKKMKANSETD